MSQLQNVPNTESPKNKMAHVTKHHKYKNIPATKGQRYKASQATWL